MTRFRTSTDLLARLLHASFLVLAVLATATMALAGAGDELPSVKVKVEALRSVSEADASALASEIVVALARSECKFRLAAPGTKAVLRLEVDLLGWQHRQEPGGAPIFDTGTGQYRSGARHELRVRYSARVIEVASGKLLKKKETSFVQNTETSKNPLYDPRAESGIRARSKLRNTVRRLLCKVARRYGKN